MDPLENIPAFTAEQAVSILREHFGVEGTVSPLPSERDQNFLVQTGHEPLVLKIANPETSTGILELENAALQICVGLKSFSAPKLIRSLANNPMTMIRDAEQHDCQVRLISFLKGTTLAKLSSLPQQACFQLGRALAELDLGLSHLNHHPAAKRELKWDLANAANIVRAAIDQIKSPQQRQVLAHHLKHFEAVESRIGKLPVAVIHNDANDYNVLIHAPAIDDEVDALIADPMIGLIDFGDMMLSTQINEVAIAGAYLLLREDWHSSIFDLTTGYHSLRPLSENELSVLFPLMVMRLCQSVCIAAQQRQQQPSNEYLSVTEAPAWEALTSLVNQSPQAIHAELSEAISMGATGARFRPAAKGQGSISNTPENQEADLTSTHSQLPNDLTDRNAITLLADRRQLLAPSLSLSYDRPLHIVRGKGQYLYDLDDVTYLDCVNNVCHVGHCHPHVVAAAQHQQRALNTNTRYLHQNLIDYARRLTGTLPDPLKVCFFVNSGSEANDLALRLARTFTGSPNVAVIDHAYHGHTSALIDISPYKFNSQGGAGQRSHVNVLDMPDGYRGRYQRESESDSCTDRYVADALALLHSIEETGQPIGAFFAESLLGCGGQVPLPPQYLPPIYQAVRNQGGVCVADEVQVGFGRVGTHFWGFEKQNVVPDIVTMGKPIGNGHPLAAVVTTRQIADAFHNGMEYFNTFGGNPVSCAVGMAVLDVIENESLQQHAQTLGEYLLEQLRQMQAQHVCIGDVRGSGLFLGIEIVADRDTKQPDAQRATQIVEAMKRRRILLSTDGPDHNVIKFKPPMVFSEGDADRLLMTMSEVLTKPKK